MVDIFVATEARAQFSPLPGSLGDWMPHVEILTLLVGDYSIATGMEWPETL